MNDINQRAKWKNIASAHPQKVRVFISLLKTWMYFILGSNFPKHPTFYVLWNEFQFFLEILMEIITRN